MQPLTWQTLAVGIFDATAPALIQRPNLGHHGVPRRIKLPGHMFDGVGGKSFVVVRDQVKKNRKSGLRVKFSILIYWQLQTGEVK